MAVLVIPHMEQAVLDRLQQRAAAHGRTTEVEARLILETALQPDGATDVWAEVNAIRERLAATGRTFSDSTELIREDRER